MLPLEIYLKIAILSDDDMILTLLSLAKRYNTEKSYQYVIKEKYPATVIYYNTETLSSLIKLENKKLELIGACRCGSLHQGARFEHCTQIEIDTWKSLFLRIRDANINLAKVKFPHFDIPSYDPIKVSSFGLAYNIWKCGALYSIDSNDPKSLDHCMKQSQHLLISIEPWLCLRWAAQVNNLYMVNCILNNYKMTHTDIAYVLPDAKGKIREIIEEKLVDVWAEFVLAEAHDE